MKINEWVKLGRIAWLLGALALGILTWLTLKQDNRLEQISSLATNLARSESRLKEAVLRTRHELEINYDRLNENSTQVRAEAHRLPPLATNHTLAQAISDYNRIVDLETEALEDFKFRNAVVQNSLLYMQHSLSPLLRALAGAGVGSEFHHDLHDYKNQVLLLALGRQSEGTDNLTVLSNKLTQGGNALPPVVRAEIQRMIAHGRLIAQNLPALRQATTRILDSGSRRMLVRISNLAQTEIARQERLRRFYYLALTAITSLMLAGLALMGSRYLLSLRQASRQRTFLQTLMDHAGVGVMVVRNDDSIAFANPEAAAILGYPLDELMTVRVHEQLHIGADGHFRPREECPVIQALVRQQKWAGETTYCRKDGSIVPVMQHSVSLAGSGEEGTMTVIQDITELKDARDALHAEQEHLEQQVTARTVDLRKAEARHRAVVEIAPDGFLALGADLCIIESNAAFQLRSGYTLQELNTLCLPALCCNLTPELLARINLEKCERGYSRFEILMRSQDGTTWPADITLAYWPDGHLDFAFVRDITEQKAAEEAREAARQEAERLTQVKSEFLANMSHEIRTPLNGVLGLAQIGYRDAGEQHKLRDTFGKIIQSGKLLLGVINDILDFSKIEAGRMSIERVPVDLPTILQEALQLQDAAAAAKGLRLELQISPELPSTCLNDPLRLAQILSNLLANAIKFTPSGRVTLRADLDGDALLISVEDTGIGMNEQQIERLFTPFEQADGSTTRRFGGTGLGLVITRRIVELMGGHVSVRSILGAGSHFQVRLPLMEAPAGRIPTNLLQDAFTSAMTAENSGDRLIGLHLLIAEDDEINRTVLEDMLGGEGARLTLAKTGREAVELVIREGPASFDCVLMDVQMPVMDGLEATRRILALAPRLPIIGQTAHALAEEKDRCLSAGMVDHIAKPVELDHLVATILKHLP